MTHLNTHVQVRLGLGLETQRTCWTEQLAEVQSYTYACIGYSRQQLELTQLYQHELLRK
jgi:hypothetical protein